MESMQRHPISYRTSFSSSTASRSGRLLQCAASTELTLTIMIAGEKIIMMAENARKVIFRVGPQHFYFVFPAFIFRSLKPFVV